MQTAHSLSNNFRKYFIYNFKTFNYRKIYEYYLCDTCRNAHAYNFSKQSSTYDMCVLNVM